MPDLIKVNQASGLLRKSKTLITNPRIGYGKSSIEGAGLGVFADTDIRDGKIVEIAPYLEADDNILRVEDINDYVFKIEEDRYCVGLGLVSLYNHSDDPNADWVINQSKNEIRIVAKKDITKGEEITISYGKSYWESRDAGKEND